MEHARRDIWVIGKDPGGFNNVRLVAELLPECQLFATGTAAELLKDNSALPVHSVEEVLKGRPLPKVLLTSMCSEGGVGRDLVPLLREKGVRTIALSDYWGSRQDKGKEWADPKYRPDLITVNDEVGRDVVLRLWPDFTAQRICITGYPNLDTFAKMDVEGEGRKMREILGLQPTIPLVLFSGQGFGTAATLRRLVATLNRNFEAHYFMPRPHPRTLNNFKGEADPWQQALADYRGYLIVDWFGQTTPAKLIAACQPGVVINMYSTPLMEAAAARIPAISMLTPEAEAAMHQELPWMTEHPVVTARGAACVRTEMELAEVLDQAFSGTLRQKLLPAQKRQFRLDGRNAQRVADFVLEQLSA